MTFGSLFAGIGGFDLGFERAGLRCSWQVEIDPFCQKVLAKHWPNVPRHDDITTFLRDDVDLDQWKVDVLCGGFPCQDISLAGKGVGINGKRSGLWAEYARLIGLLRPRFVVVENVRALVGRGLGRVLGDLAGLGYDAEWQIISAAAFGAPHVRERLFIVAYPETNDFGAGIKTRRESTFWSEEDNFIGNSSEILADSDGMWPAQSQGSITHIGGRVKHSGQSCRDYREHWLVEPGMGRLAHGIPGRVARLRGLGNAVVPQIAEWIGRKIMSFETISGEKES